MSLITKDCFETIKGDFLEPSDICFHCGKQLEGLPVIMWKGFPNQIWIHIDCSLPLALGILRDFMELKIGKEAADEIHKRDKQGFNNK